MKREFEAYQKQENARFEDFRARENKAFAEFLKSGKWIEVPAREALPPVPSPPLPAEIIRPDLFIPPQSPKPDSASDSGSIPHSPTLVEKPEEVEINPIAPPAGLRLVTVSLPGYSLQAPVPDNLSIRLGGMTESEISQGWNALSHPRYQMTTKWLMDISDKLNLHDWAKYLLVKNMAKKMAEDENQQLFLTFFYWNQIGYHARIARSSEGLLLLVPSVHQLYGLPFVVLDGNRYYILGGRYSATMTTFSKDFSKNNRPLNMFWKKTPVFGNQFAQRHLQPRTPVIQANIPYPIHLIELMDAMPLTDLDVIFRSAVNDSVRLAFQHQLGPALKGKSPEEQVQFLLSFVQHSFSYQTDQEQFGREKYFYVEETLHYPYSDCEDRSVLFAWLVRTFTGLPVIGLNYDAHVAVAVAFQNPVRGDALEWKGKRFTVCDPTYIGADIGMTMPAVKGQTFRVIETE